MTTVQGPTFKKLARYSALEHLLLGDLREILEQHPDRHTRAWLLSVLDALLQIVPDAQELKEQDGYLADVLAEFPQWDPEVEELRWEHWRLVHRLRYLRYLTDQRLNCTTAVSETCRQLRRWMQGLEAVRNREHELVQTAANLDFGGEG